MKLERGMVIVHTPSGGKYRVMSFGKMRLSSGEWVEAARYISLTLLPEEFYRPLSDFGNFKEVEDGKCGKCYGAGCYTSDYHVTIRCVRCGGTGRAVTEDDLIREYDNRPENDARDSTPPWE